MRKAGVNIGGNSNGGTQDYFIADVVYVKCESGVPTRAIVIESKLQSGTNLTAKQNIAYLSSEDFVVRNTLKLPNGENPPGGSNLTAGLSLPQYKEWLKVFDSQFGNIISGIIKP